MESLLPFIIACPLAFLAGVVDAIGGGGGLITLPGFIMAGLPMHLVLGTNKMSSSMGTALATFRFWRQGLIQWRRALPCAACGLAGSVAGAHVALLIDDGVFRAIMVVVIPLTALYLMRGRSLDAERDPFGDRRTLALCAAISLGIGLYDGVYGPGTGTFLMIGFTTFAHLTLGQAAGTTKVVNLTTNFSALMVFLMNGQVWLLLGVCCGLCNMAGNYLGVSLFTSKGAAVTKPIMLTVLAIFMVKTLGEMAGVF
ncbi:MAG: sulfite exporter TauE/SafE family protein [Coriobacteriia bacterium]|nr:sulfite exporter TauE/SafE family protein [Coriobacteriia bacterium]